MRTLRACGFTNQQISQLTNGRWKRDAVKKATASTKVTSPEIAQTALSLLTTAAINHLTLTDLQDAVQVHAQVGSLNKLKKIVDFLEKLKENDISIDEFLQDYSKMKQNKLTALDLKTAITYKNDLEAAGFNLTALTQMKSLADKYGNASTILTALESYGNLNAINNELANRKTELYDTKKLIETVDAQLEKHKALEQSSKALSENYTELQQALTDGAKNVSKDLSNKLQTITGTFETETKDKISKLSTDYATEVKNQLETISTTINNLTAPFEENAKKLLDTLQNVIKSADTLTNAYATLQQSLQSSIQNLPGQLKRELDKITDEFRSETKKNLTQTSKDFTTAVAENLEKLNTSLRDLKTQFEQNNEAFSKSVTDAIGKATAAVTSLASLAMDTASKDQNQYRASLESIQQETVNRIDEVKKAIDRGRGAITNAINEAISEATKNIAELSNRAVEAGEKFKEVELRYAESKPYMDLVKLVRDPTSATPPILATLTGVVKAFLEWLATKPPSISHRDGLVASGNAFLRSLQDEFPTI
jgi:uncharacterized membrane-anchored protein YhcB (DUF1043 family)